MQVPYFLVPLRLVSGKLETMTAGFLPSHMLPHNLNRLIAILDEREVRQYLKRCLKERKLTPIGVSNLEIKRTREFSTTATAGKVFCVYRRPQTFRLVHSCASEIALMYCVMCGM